MTPPEAQPPTDRIDLWNHANDVLYVHDLTGRFTAVNEMAVQVYGYSEAELLAMNIANLVEPADLPKAQANMQAKATGRAQRTAPYELRTQSKTGQPVWVEVSTRVLLRDDKPYAIHGAARVVTARKQAEAIADLVHETSLALSSAASLQDGVRDAIARIATAAQWTYAEAWFPSEDGSGLELGPQWTGGPGLEKFSRLARQIQFAPGEGMLGRAWSEGKAHWAPELPSAEECPRRASASAAGLRTFASIPVIHDGRVAAVLLFLGPEAHDGYSRWVDAATKIAAQMGATIGRSLDTERVRAAARMFAAQFEALDDALLLLDPEGRPRQANRAFLQLCGVNLVNNDAAIPLPERVDDPERFLSAASSLYEDRSEGRAAVRVGERNMHRAMAPLRSRSGANLGMMLCLREADDAPA